MTGAQEGFRRDQNAAAGGPTCIVWGCPIYTRDDIHAEGSGVTQGVSRGSRIKQRLPMIPNSHRALRSGQSPLASALHFLSW